MACLQGSLGCGIPLQLGVAGGLPLLLVLLLELTDGCYDDLIMMLN